MIEGLVALLIVMIIVALVIGMMAWLVQQREVDEAIRLVKEGK